MRSRASYKGHPIHPALIPFPFAFLYGAFVFDLLGRLFGSESLWTTGAHLTLAGISMALVAAVAGRSSTGTRSRRTAPGRGARPNMPR